MAFWAASGRSVALFGNVGIRLSLAVLLALGQGLHAATVQEQGSLTADASSRLQLAKVQYVVDGDSLWVRMVEGGRRIKLRLHGIDAPEICQLGGRQSREALQYMARDELVQVSVVTRDRYGRAVAHVYRQRDGMNLARLMVSGGWAWSVGGANAAYAGQQRLAEQNNLGIFSPGLRTEHPAEFRRHRGSCKSPRAG